jgi:trans-aconitate 2-methyltransferase
MPDGTTDWDARTYDRLAAPQEQWAREVLARLPLHGEEAVLDAGCGSGRATRLLLERLPKGRDAFTDAVLAHMKQPLVLHYVRLNLEAVAGGSAGNPLSS